MNIELSQQVITQLLHFGVREFICCAGARNAPLIKLIYKVKGIKVHSFFEERSAGFFAIGRIKAEGKPVCVVTTSGTAVANLLPSVMEAYHAELPLVVLSADRPKSFRGSGAPQSTLQAGLFSNFANSHDVDHVEPLNNLKLEYNKPNQINVCFDEPLMDKEIPVINATKVEHIQVKNSDPILDLSQVIEFKNKSKKPLVIVSQLNEWEAQKIAPLLEPLNVPIYIEAHSQMTSLLSNTLYGGERAVKKIVEEHQVDGVIRIGGIPTLRFWRDLENLKYPVINYGQKSFTGLSYIHSDVLPLNLLEKLIENNFVKGEKVDQIDQNCSKQLFSVLKKFPESEVSFIKKLLEQIPVNDQIFIGNSLAIRELDMVFPFINKLIPVHSQRGLNGIDGLVSTGLGLANNKNTTWIVLGDLTTLYDLSGLWAALRDPELKFKIIIINNGGGKIFQKIFSDPTFENRHGLGFEGWANMWGMSYKKINSLSEVSNIQHEKIIELLPNSRDSKLFWNEL